MLVADEIDRVLPTIRSRCRLIRAGAPTREQSLEWLKSQGVQEAERKLTEAGGMPLAVFDEDARFRLSDEMRERFLAYLKLGRAAPPAQALSVADQGRDAFCCRTLFVCVGVGIWQVLRLAVTHSTFLNLLKKLKLLHKLPARLDSILGSIRCAISDAFPNIRSTQKQ